MSAYDRAPEKATYRDHASYGKTDAPFDLDEHVIFATVSGSRAYGMETKESDTDVRGVFIPPERFILGMQGCDRIQSATQDTVFYGLRRFVDLACNANVHALELLFMDPRFILKTTEFSESLGARRNIFMSKVIGHSYSGYAFQQVAKLTTKQGNNTGRADLIARYGFDTKMAAHAVRLWRTGREALETGRINVMRPDAAELLAIRNGAYTLDEFAVLGEDERGMRILVGGVAAREKAKFDEALARSTLPKTADFAAADALVVTLHKEFFRQRERTAFER